MSSQNKLSPHYIIITGVCENILRNFLSRKYTVFIVAELTVINRNKVSVVLWGKNIVTEAFHVLWDYMYGTLKATVTFNWY